MATSATSRTTGPDAGADASARRRRSSVAAPTARGVSQVVVTENGRRISIAEHVLSATELQPAADLISSHAEHFRSRLIDHFRLLDAGIDDEGNLDAPLTTSRRLTEVGEAEFQRYMTDNPFALVNFKLATAVDKGDQDQVKSLDRRMMRLEYRLGKSIVPLIQITASNILSSKFFDGFILALVVLNSLTLGIQAELKTNLGDGVIHDRNPQINLYLDYFDRFCLLMFVIEILLKWIDNFLEFWLNGWNIFDFIVTMMSVIPEVMRLFADENRNHKGKKINTYFKVLNNIRIFRIFRSLKTVTRIEKVRLLVSAIINAFTAMVFITILLGVFLYIFAIFGVIVFRGSTDELEEEYKTDQEFERFGNMGAAMATLFQIFTLDNWLIIAKKTEETGGPLTYLYVILWILIGSFIFNNIFVGIMVNNFQNIRNELFREVKEMEQTHRIAKETIEAMESTQDGLEPPTVPSSKSMPRAAPSERHWERQVDNTLELLHRHSQETVWPKDTLFQYLLLMEALLENREERRQLNLLAKDALLTLHDD